MLEWITYYLKNRIFKTSYIAGIIGAVLLPLLVLFTVSDVVSRYFFNSPIKGDLELTQIILGISVFTTLAFCAIEEGGHVEVDVLVNRLPKKNQKSILSVMYLLSVIMLGILSWQLFAYAMKVNEMHEISAILAISPFAFIVIGALGIALLALMFLVHTLANVMEVLKK